MRKKSLNNLKRRKNFKPTRKNFLIVCEGEKTEPNYFSNFRVPKKIFDVIGIGANTESLVRRAIQLKNREYVSYDYVWCVFDRDSFPPQNFNNALILANNKYIILSGNLSIRCKAMTKVYNTDLSDYRLEKAKELAEESNLLFENKRHDGSVNRSYYAIFNAIRSLLALVGLDSRKHSGVISFFDRYFVKPGIFSKEYSKIVHNSFSVRQASDYQDIDNKIKNTF